MTTENYLMTRVKHYAYKASLFHFVEQTRMTQEFKYKYENNKQKKNKESKYEFALTHRSVVTCFYHETTSITETERDTL